MDQETLEQNTYYIAQALKAARHLTKELETLETAIVSNAEVLTVTSATKRISTTTEKIRANVWLLDSNYQA